MSIILSFGAILAGAYLFLFVFWRRLKEDYSGSLILHSGTIFVLLTLLGAVAARILSSFLSPSAIFLPSGLWFWGACVGFLLAFAISTRKLKLKAVESFEAAGIASLYSLLIAFLLNYSWQLFLVTAFSLVIFNFLERTYRNFHWYKSGRVGFSGLAAIGFFFLLRTIAVLVVASLPSTIGRVDLVLSAVSAFLLFFSLYNLAES